MELAIRARKRRIHPTISPESLLQEIEARFVVLPIRAYAPGLCNSPHYPKDPADRLIGATALAEGLSLVTADSEIRLSKALATIW